MTTTRRDISPGARLSTSAYQGCSAVMSSKSRISVFPEIDPAMMARPAVSFENHSSSSAMVARRAWYGFQHAMAGRLWAPMGMTETPAPTSVRAVWRTGLGMIRPLAGHDRRVGFGHYPHDGCWEALLALQDGGEARVDVRISPLSAWCPEEQALVAGLAGDLA